MTPKRPRITLAEAIENVFYDLRARGRAKTTMNIYRYWLDQFGAFLAARGRAYLADVTAADITAFFGHLRESGKASTSVAASATPVGRLFNLAVQNGTLLAAKNPWPKASKPRGQKELEAAFTPDELRRLIAAAQHGKHGALIFVLLDTGLRISEACALTVRDIDLDTGRVTVRAGKGGKGRLAFVSEPTAAALRSVIARRGLGPDDRFFSGPKAASYFLQHTGQRAGVQNVHAHRFRKTFAVMFVRAGCDLERLRQLMGHASYVMLQRHYLPLVADDLENAHHKFSPVAGLHLEDGG